MKVYAYDKEGRTFSKEVSIDNTSKAGPIIDFGWPCRYYIEDIMRNPPEVGGRICIYAAGRNHKLSPVYIDWTKELIDLLMENSNA